MRIRFVTLTGTDGVQWLDYKWSPSDLISDHVLADLAQCLNCVERGLGEPDYSSCFCFLLFLRVSVKRKHPGEWGERLKEEADATGGRWEEGDREEKAGRRKSIIWTKHFIHLGQLPLCVCVCVRVFKGLYKGSEQPTPMYKYSWCRWWSREKGQGVIQHTHITPPLSFSPFHQSILSSSSPPPPLHLQFVMLLQCVSMGKTQNFTWQANCDL